jgi:hypothetical protein
VADVTNLEDVKAVFNKIEEASDDAFYEIPYASVGLFAEDGEEGVPDGWTISVHESQTERNYDSYGNAYTEDGYVVFRVEDDVDSALYLLPVNYASYDGWSIDVSKMVKTEKKEKVVTTWEWVR